MASPESAKSLLVVGFGYLGQRAAHQALKAGWKVYATSRRIEKKAEMESAGVEFIHFDITRPEDLDHLPESSAWIWSPAFDRRQGLPVHEVIVGGLKRALNQAPALPQKVIYTSTTSVYHQSGGEWVDETSTTEPRTDSGKANLEAEQFLTSWAVEHGRQAIILRLSGLYGPGRWIRRASIQAGEPIACEPDTWLNLVHIDDAASACLAALETKESGTYCITDNQPILRREFYETSARLLQAPAPSFTPPTSPDFAGNKRVSNQKAREKLAWKPKFGDVNSGLLDCF